MSDLSYDEWADAVREGRLLGLACSCGHTNGSPTAACPHCGSRDLERVDLPTEGVVHTETTIQVPPSAFETRGYQVVVVEVGSARVMGRVEEPEVEIGDEVTLTDTIAEDDGRPAPVFEPT